VLYSDGFEYAAIIACFQMARCTIIRQLISLIVILLVGSIQSVAANTLKNITDKLSFRLVNYPQVPVAQSF